MLHCNNCNNHCAQLKAERQGVVSEAVSEDSSAKQVRSTGSEYREYFMSRTVLEPQRRLRCTIARLRDCMIDRSHCAQAALAERTTMQRMERMKLMISKQRARAASREARKRRLRAKLRSNFRSSLGSLALAHPQALPTQPRVGAFGAKAARFMRSLSEHSLRPIDSAKGFCLWACDRAAPRAALLSFVGIKSSREPKPSMVRFRRIVLRVQTMGLLSKGFFKWLSTVRVYSLNTLRVKVEVGPSSLLVACRAGWLV